MDVKDFLYNEDLTDVHKAFLYYNFSHVSTTITSIRNNKYKLNDFKFDCKQNFLLKFPEIKDFEFEEFWKNIINKFERFKINFFEELGFEEADIIYKIAKNQVYRFVTEKMKMLDTRKSLKLKEFLKNGPDNTIDYNIEYIDEDGDFFISLGLLYKGAYYNSKGDLRNTEYYYYPRYFSKIRDNIIKNIESKGLKSEKKGKANIIKKSEYNLENEEEIYKLKLILKGKKDKKKIKLGITHFNIGAEFGGQEQETLEISCGNCGKSDKFLIQDQIERILRCKKCGKLNKPFGKDKYYFE